RPILAATAGEAWDRARAILDRVLVNRGNAAPPTRHNVGSNRLLQAAAEAEVHDTCLWTSLAVATGAQGNSTALVGTPETVAKAMLEYYKLGATSLLIRGYDPRPDAVQYGEELIPRLREPHRIVKRRSRKAALRWPRCRRCSPDRRPGRGRAG